MFAPTPLQSVHDKVLSFYDKMTELYKFLVDNNAPPEILIHANQFPLEFYIDKNAIARLLVITQQADFAQFGVFFGAEPLFVPPPDSSDEYAAFGHLTACFVGLNNNNEIISCHHQPVKDADGTSGGGIPPEETWPPGGGGTGGGTGSGGSLQPPGSGYTGSLNDIFYLDTPRHTVDDYFTP
jgi:hypothetical protein